MSSQTSSVRRICPRELALSFQLGMGGLGVRLDQVQRGAADPRQARRLLLSRRGRTSGHTAAVSARMDHRGTVAAEESMIDGHSRRRQH
jgi:hypothetical protein